MELNDFLFVTYSDFKSVLKFFKINYRQIKIDTNNENCKVIIEIYKIKWFQFIKKFDLKNCKNFIEKNKPVFLKIEYKNYEKNNEK